MGRPAPMGQLGSSWASARDSLGGDGLGMPGSPGTGTGSPVRTSASPGRSMAVWPSGSPTSARADCGKVKTFQRRKSQGVHRSGRKRWPCPRGKYSGHLAVPLHGFRSRRASALLGWARQTQQQSVEQSSLAGVPPVPALFSLGSSSTKAIAKAQW